MECTFFVWSLWIWYVLCTQVHVTKDETLLMSLGATGSGVGKRNSTPCLGNCLQQTKWTVKVTQSCPTLCDCIDYTVLGILQARILEWVAFPFSSGSSWPRNWTRVSCIGGGFFTNWAIRESRWFWINRIHSQIFIEYLLCMAWSQDTPVSYTDQTRLLLFWNLHSNGGRQTILK